ncbi:CDP-alcohol phosphatidyltransferase family protein [Ensifer soli]|uniref:CDP-alcohol phosphatidyltransferase family protein n=1 Tax=Ciceribacter sp. sgz301302 TaxID=3342379 RepID=UPI0035B81650
MPAAERAPARDRVPRPVLRPVARPAGVLPVLGAVLLGSLGFFLVADRFLAIGSGAVAVAAATLLVVFAFVVRGLPHHPYPRLGAANLVTALRAAMASLAAGLAVAGGDLAASPFLPSALALMTVLFLLLDGLDGHLARRRGETSALGARFDMEVDALMILALSAIVFFLGKAGIWVLAIGLLRYGFVGAGLVLPALNAPLPPSFRRKLVCVLQIAVLLLLLLPPLAPPLSAALAASALASLIYSFAVDIRHLLATGRKA